MIAIVSCPNGKKFRYAVSNFSDIIKIAHDVKKKGGRTKVKIPASWNK